MKAPSVPLLLALLLAIPFASSAQDGAPTSPPAEVKDAENTAAVRRFRVGPSFLFDGSAGGGPVDPFAPADPSSSNDRPPSSVQQTLTEELGIDFPEGTYARYDPRTGALELRHHPAVMQAIQAYLEALNPPSRQLHVRVEIYETATADAMRMVRLSDTSDDDTDIWEVLQNLVDDKSNGARIVNSVSVQARSGQRAKAEDKSEFIYPTEVDWYKEDKVIVPAAFETRDWGTIFEVDPVIGADDVTIDLNFALEHHTAPPTMQPITVASPDGGTRVTAVEMPEFHCKRITTQVTVRANTIKLVGSWRPTGKPEYADADLMQVAFLRVAMQTIRTVVPEK